MVNNTGLSQYKSLKLRALAGFITILLGGIITKEDDQVMKKCKFILRLKGSQEYLKRIHDGIWFTTEDINSALKWECNTDISKLKMDEDKYEIVAMLYDEK